MIWSKSAKRATKAEREHLAAVKCLPCAACEIEHELRSPFGRPFPATQCGDTEGHHGKSGNVRIGHHACIPLGRWHHEGIPLFGMTSAQMLKAYGPSRHKHQKAFTERYGTDLGLAEATNKRLARQSPANGRAEPK